MFKLRSLDVIHSFFVPELLREARRGARASPPRCASRRPGSAPIPAECTELCGAGHSLMRATRPRRHAVRLPDLAGHQPANGAAAGRDHAAERHERRAGLRVPVLRRLGVVLVVESASGSSSTTRHRPRARPPRAQPRRARARPRARPCSPARPAAAAATRWPRPAPPGPSGPDLDTSSRATAPARPPRRPAARPCSSASRPRSPSRTRTSRRGYSAGIMPSNFAPDPDHPTQQFQALGQLHLRA